MSPTDVLSPVTLSSTAAARVKKVLAREVPGSVLRVAVDGEEGLGRHGPEASAY